MGRSIIHLSRDEAEYLFGSYEDWDPMYVINNRFKELEAADTDETFTILDKEISFLMLVLKTYLSYKSKDVRYLIMGICKRYIEDMYSKGQTTLSLENLKFLEMFIFRFRNIKDYRRVKKHFLEPVFFSKFQRALFENGAFHEYQGTLFK